MSSTSNQRQKASSQYPTYQPIPQTVGSSMDNPAMTRSTSSADDSLDRTGAGTLPSTYSSQQLMPPSDSDSVEEGDRLGGGTTPTTNCAPGTVRCITRSQWFTVGVLCFVNLINYMDRFTIAGVLEDIQGDFGIGDDDAGLLQTVFVLSYMVCAPIFGYLGDRYSRRWIMAIGVLLWSTTTLLGSFMNNFGWFITFRALVGIGEASYSTIAPTIISDLFVHDLRSKMLAVFYFAIPVGSGFGYIVGSETAHLAGNWRWALRVTPILGIAAVIFIWLIKDPERGESEGSHNLSTTTYGEDVKYLMKNKSFMLSTAGFTCVAFVAGALAWWAPKFIFLGLKMQPGNENLIQNDVSYKFGMITMLAGLIGVPLGSVLAQRLRTQIENCDPYICAAGLLISAPMAYMAIVLPQTSSTLCFLFIFGSQVALNLCWSIVADIFVSFKFGAITMVAGIIGVPLGSILSQKMAKRFPTADPLICAFGLIFSVPLLTGAMIIVTQNSVPTYVLIFLGQLSLNMNWAIVADILLYVVVPTRRSTAEAFQILISHALGDAGSPYLVGVLSEAIKKHLRTTAHRASELVSSGSLESLSLTLGEVFNSTTTTTEASSVIMPSTTLSMESQNLALTEDTDLIKFEALQYSLFSTSFVEVIGGIFFLITAAFIIKDKNKASQAIREGHQAVPVSPVDINEIS
ncbi:Protein spinster [Lucilia cuprina]|uniref:Protein spinster n=1 Tax=Lucilia cuprina TaxID=7375 RepID=A0A0L0CKJ6_LUCCU|nr:Protein spinster [Lucilia cuprina]KNC31989.1 Protein spinster [Lucilia cuprina]